MRSSQQAMFMRLKMTNHNPIPVFRPAPPIPTEPPERVQGTKRSRMDSADELFTASEREVLNTEFVNSWVRQQQRQQPSAIPTSAPESDSAPQVVLVDYSPSSSSICSRQSGIRPVIKHPAQDILKKSGLQHFKSPTVAHSPSTSLKESPVNHPQASMKDLGTERPKSTTAAKVTRTENASDERDKNPKSKDIMAIESVKSVHRTPVASSSKALLGQNQGIKRSRSRSSSKRSDSKSTTAGGVTHIDHDKGDENRGSNEKTGTRPVKTVPRTPNARSSRTLSEQNQGRGSGTTRFRLQSSGSAKRSLNFENEPENVDPQNKKSDYKKRYGNTSRVVPMPDKQGKGDQNTLNDPTASKDASPIESLRSPETNSGKSLRKRKNVKYTYEKEEDDTEEENWDHWDYSGSDDDLNKEWKPAESEPEHSSADEVGTSDEESTHSVDHSDGRLLGIVPDEKEDGNNCDTATPQQTVRELNSERKEKRNSGQKYISKNGVSKNARVRTPVHHCTRRKCHEVLSEDMAENLFYEYWEQASYDKRVNYICNRVESLPVERHRQRNPNSGRVRKEVAHKYYFDVGGVRVNVCKETFLGTLGETDKFVYLCTKKKKANVSGIPPDDARGKRKPKHSVKQVLRKRILDHIHSYPAYVSHYCRKQTKQKYLPHTLNLKMMFEQFNAQQANADESGNAEEDDEIMSEEDNAVNAERATAVKKVSYSTYRRVFKTLNLKFKAPASDTCKTCDKYKIQVKITKDDEKRKALKEEHELHLRRAEAAYTLKRQFKAKAKEDSSVGCLIFDLEQVLPTPCVSTGVAYYLRQLNTYNLTIVDARTNTTFCYMWHEGEGARGANEIASSLYHHLKYEVPETVKELYLFSDCCSGQNRNSIVSSMFQVLLSQKPSLKSINHIFLIPGHTRMECDAKHSLIERQKQRTSNIDVPQDWYNLVRNTSSSFRVIEMSQKFYDFESLTDVDGPLIMREKKDDGSKMYWTKTVWFQYKEPGIVSVKPSYNTSAGFEQLNMIRGTGKNRRLKKNWNKLQKCNRVNKISEEKKQNLMTLMEYVDSKHHEFYRNLVVDPTIVQDTDVDLPSDNEDIEEIEDLEDEFN